MEHEKDKDSIDTDHARGAIAHDCFTLSSVYYPRMTVEFTENSCTCDGPASIPLESSN